MMTSLLIARFFLMEEEEIIFLFSICFEQDDLKSDNKNKVPKKHGIDVFIIYVSN